MDLQSRPEPMNATTHHSKVKVSVVLPPNQVFVAGGHVSGKMEMECRADKGLGISTMMVELFAIQDLSSRDHSATSTFLHSRRLFQGPGLPPSNAVQAHPMPGDPQLPQHYHQARRGTSTFLFRIPLPDSCPSSINFGSNLARVRYEVKASVQVFWRGDKSLVTDRKEVQVVESFIYGQNEPEGTVVGENGKIWAQGRIVGGFIVAGESACVELQVKNHSNKRNTGLLVTLTRTLHLPGSSVTPLQLSDTLVTVPFRGSEYIIPPGAEGVASLVFDVPKDAKGARGGTLLGEDRTTESLFEVRCVVGVKMTMGLGSKDINLELPVSIVHPIALPDLPPPPPPMQYPYAHVPSPPMPIHSPYASPPPLPGYIYPLPMSPIPVVPYQDQNMVYFPPALHQQPYFPQQPQYFPPIIPERPSSAEPPAITGQEMEEGKGQRASRIAQHLRMSSRNRSVSPMGARNSMSSSPLPPPPTAFSSPPSGTRQLPIPPQVMQNLPPQRLSISTSPFVPPQTLSPVLHSPRPVLSPKQSFSNHVDMISHKSLPKSERVEDLERMAEEVGKDLSGGISTEDAEPSSNVNKTLPVPPPVSSKISETRPRADVYFSSSAVSTPKQESSSHPTPRTPTLKAKRTFGHLNVNGSGNGNLSVELSPSGLDALEAKLLAQVGTRKEDAPRSHHPDVRSVMPIDIPPRGKGEGEEEGLNDSAISSLTLGVDVEEEEGEGTHKGKSVKSMYTKSGDEKRGGAKSGDEKKGGAKSGDERKTGAKSGDERERERERRERKKERKGGSGEVHKMRKAAKGKVAAWLGGVDPEVPPPSDESIPPSPNTPRRDVEADAVVQETTPVVEVPPPRPLPQPEREEEHKEKTEDSPTTPNPRSSGFVPIGTLKRDPVYGRTLVPTTPTVHARRVADIWSSPASARTNREVSPPSAPHDKLEDNPWDTISPPALKENKGRLPVFLSPQTDPEVKYDVRSARGGRGGKVTSVKAMWTSALAGVNEENKQPPIRRPVPTKPLAKPPLSSNPPPSSTKPLLSRDKSTGDYKAPPPSSAGKKPFIKSTSVPAVVSSSQAKPMISSTASLARPSPVAGKGVPSKATSSSSSSPFKPSYSPALIRSPPVSQPKSLTPTAASRSPAPAALANLRQVKMPTTISELPHDSPTGSSSTAPKPAPVKDLAFGQARLRDLIKKYQGTAGT